jgi:hypothetical protein
LKCLARWTRSSSLPRVSNATQYLPSGFLLMMLMIALNASFCYCFSSQILTMNIRLTLLGNANIGSQYVLSMISSSIGIETASLLELFLAVGYKGFRSVSIFGV